MLRNIPCDCSVSQFPGGQRGVRTGLGMGRDRPQSNKSALPFLHVFPMEQESAMSGCRRGLVEESAGSCCMQGRAPIASVSDAQSPSCLARRCKAGFLGSFPRLQESLDRSRGWGQREDVTRASRLPASLWNHVAIMGLSGKAMPGPCPWVLQACLTTPTTLFLKLISSAPGHGRSLPSLCPLATGRPMVRLAVGGW